MKRIISLSLILTLAITQVNGQVKNDSLVASYDTIDWDRYLDQVTVTAVKPLIKIEADKMTYDVSNDVESKSSTVLDMLRKVPMVTVDGQDNITVNGSSSYKVYVDGKPNPMFSQNASQIFKMMPASVVSEIEVITNPGAKYDAEGSVGILNIKLSITDGGSSAIEGITATIRGAVGNRGYNGGVSFTGQEGKLSLSGNIMGTYQRISDIEHVNERNVLSESSQLIQTLKTTQRVHFLMGNINMNYNLDSLNTISASFGLSGYQMKGGYNPTVEYNSPFMPSYKYQYEGGMKLRNVSYNLSADWQHFFNTSKDKFLTISYLLSHSPQESETTQIYDLTAGTPDIYNHNKPKSLEQTIQLDYTMPLGTGQTLNLGSKFINRRNKSLSKYYELTEGSKSLIDDNTLDYRHTSNIGAAYAEYEANFGIASAKAGLRYEHTWQNIEYRQGVGDDFKLDYGNLVPSLSLSFRPSMTKNIGLTYNIRISRPGITYLNPYIDRTNPMNITYGNSNLDVEKNHNIGISYGSFSNKLMYNISLHQSFCNDRINNYSYYEDQMLFTTYGNIVKERNSSLSAFVNWLIFSKTRFLMNAEIGYVDLRSSQLEQNNHGWSESLFVGIQQTLPWEIKLGLNGVVNSKNYNLQGWSSGFRLLIGSLSKSFINDRLNISLQGIIGLNKGFKLNIDNYSEGKDFTNLQTIHVPISQFNISLSYTLGNTKVKASRHKSRIENDFTERKSEQEQMSTGTSSGLTGIGQDM